MKKPDLNSMKLVFNEDFDVALNEGHWADSDYPKRFFPVIYDGGIQTSVNGEVASKPQKLVNKNISCRDSILVLKAKESETDYTGAELRTTKFFNYGYFEIRARLKASSGICPAFWLLGSRDCKSGISYEVDAFECFGKTPELIKFTLLAHDHTEDPLRENAKTEWRFVYNRITDRPIPDNFDKTFTEENWNEEFHTFGIDWRQNGITLYIDGEAVISAVPTEVFNGKYKYNEPMRVILTCYSGRDVCSPKTGLPNSLTDWENGSSLEVDYLKIWQY